MMATGRREFVVLFIFVLAFYFASFLPLSPSYLNWMTSSASGRCAQSLPSFQHVPWSVLLWCPQRLEGVRPRYSRLFLTSGGIGAA